MTQKVGIVCWLCERTLQEQFHSDRRRMAGVLMVGEAALNRALDGGMDDEEGAQETQTVMEQLLHYCVVNHLSIDALMAEYKQGE